MGFFTKKRNIDTVSIVSIVLVSVIISLLSSWLYFSPQVEKTKESYEYRINFLKDQQRYLKEKNAELKEKLLKVKDALNPDEEKQKESKKDTE